MNSPGRMGRAQAGSRLNCAHLLKGHKVPMACSGRATAPICSHDPELFCTKLQVPQVHICSLRSYCFPFLHTFQHLSGLYLSHILLLTSFWSLLIISYNVHKSIIWPFYHHSSSPRAGPPQIQTSLHGCNLCSVLGFTGIWCTLIARLTTLLQVAKQVPGPAQDASYWSNLEICTTQENVGYEIWKQKQRIKEMQEYTNTIPRTMHVFH